MPYTIGRDWRQCRNIDRAERPAHEASRVTVYGSEFYVESTRLLMEVIGAAAMGGGHGYLSRALLAADAAQRA